jgi:hypothetical protein
VATNLTPAEPPIVCHVARNSITTINQLNAQVPHDTQGATEQAIKKHNETLKRNYNKQVKKRCTDQGMDLGALVVTQDVGGTPDVFERPTPSTERRRRTQVVPVLPG